MRLLFEDEQSQKQTEPEEVPDDLAEPATTSKRHKRGRRKLADHLPRVELEHTLNEQACQCEHCHAVMEPLSQKITEQLDIVPAQVRVIRHSLQTYQCPHCEGSLTTTPMPPQPIPGCNATPGKFSYLIIAKYLEGMPLYRLE